MSLLIQVSQEKENRTKVTTVCCREGGMLQFVLLWDIQGVQLQG